MLFSEVISFYFFIPIIIIITSIPLFVNRISEIESKKGENSMNQIRERMKKLGITQVNIILELKERGITVQPHEMSSILRGTYTYPKAKRVLNECDKILTEHESH
jgi:predicted transcriptional regulator